MATVDLWPDDIATDAGLEGPTTLLREQAALLGQKTKNLVEAEVKTIHDNLEHFAFSDIFTISSPSLNYRYSLFRVDYPLEFFPSYVVWENFRSQVSTEDGLPARKVDSKEELEKALQEIFSHQKTVRIVQALISRSRI